MSGSFERFISRTWAPLGFHLAFLAVTVAIVALGVKSGIEKFSKICLPVLFALVVLIAVYSLTLPGAQKGVAYLFKPDFSKVTIGTCLDALGQSFYSLSLGMGIIITYSSYVSKKENLMASGVGTAVSDMLFAVLAGVAIMPAVFAAGIEPGSGPGLIFDTLPYIFARMGLEMPWLSSVAAILFFLTILFAALTSSISLIEVGVAYLTEERGFKRGWACVFLFVITGVLGGLCSLSFGPLADVKVFGMGLFDLFDTLASNVLLTVGGLLVVLFVGWKMSRADVFDELTNGGTKRRNVRLFNFFYFLIRYVAPVGVAILILFDAAVPDLVLEALRAAVQVVGAVVDRERVLLAVQRELSVLDPVREAAGHFSGARAVSEIVKRIRVAEHDVVQLAVLVRNDDRYDGRADTGQFHIGAGGVLQGIQEDFLAVRGGSPEFFGDFHIVVCLGFLVLQI